ncbi:hypothetical protein ACFQT0_13595 [Hymenobacter humi]|uniref:Uncharacterized protein n=1 Tax=Hymenobacter humi TaxID=1411620 RepID=A0ABW2U637_9BACT
MAATNVGRDSYLRMIDGLPYGDDPRQGYVEGGVFYHPDLKFRMPVPSGWKSQNSPSQFQMAEPSGKAMIVLVPASGNSSMKPPKAWPRPLACNRPTPNAPPSTASRLWPCKASKPPTSKARPEPPCWLTSSRTAATTTASWG